VIEPAAITGLGLISALGAGKALHVEALGEGRSGIRALERFSTDGFASRLGATVPEQADDPLIRTFGRALSYALRAAREALDEAASPADPRRFGLVLGTSLGSPTLSHDELCAGLADALGLRGTRIVVSTACSSSTHALGLAKELLDGGHCDAVLAGGTDELDARLHAGFSSLGVLGGEPCAPFSERMGTTLGEGAGFVVLEPTRRAHARSARVIAFLRGHAISADAFHATSPDPSGDGVRRCMKRAIADAGLAPSDIDYVNAHGTGTEANDHAEWLAMERLFGAGRTPLVSSSKGMLGHAQGAAGILELGLTLLCIQQGSVPPTLGFEHARPRCPADPVAGTRPRRHAVRHFMSNSSAFGGANASVVLSTADGATLRPAEAPRRRDLAIAAEGFAGPAGLELDALARGPWPRQLSGRAQALRAAPELRSFDLRGLDPSAWMLLAAVHRALLAAKLPAERAARERVGLFVAQTRLSPLAVQAYETSIAQRGLAQLHAPAFARMVLHAAGGEVTRALGLRGAVTAISTGASSGTSVLALAAEHLASRSDLDALVVAGVHELGPDDDPSRSLEGAAALVLVPARVDDGPAVRLEAWSLAGPGDVRERPTRGERPGERAPSASGLSGVLDAAVAARRVRLGIEDRSTTEAWSTNAWARATIREGERSIR